MDIWVARQPILDRKQQLYGYELLFRRRSDSDSFDGANAASATTEVIANTLLGIGLDDLIPHGKAFVNLDRAMLLGGLSSILPRERVVFELLETIEADYEVLAACRDLREQGWLLALDDFVPSPETEPLTAFADIIKVDVQAIGRPRQLQIIQTYHDRRIRLLAEKVETLEEFEWAFNAGYDLFQGYFFARPALVPGRQIPPVKAAALNLLREVQAVELDFGRIESLIAGDVALSWQLLQYVNSARMSHRQRICSIGQALAMLGEKIVRQWAALATLSAMIGDKPGELLTLSLVRAHFCSYLAALGNIPQPEDGFLTGLLSSIDALLDMPFETALRRANVAPRISAALLQSAPEDDLLRSVSSLARAWESGDWERVSKYAERLSLTPAVVGDAYRESVLWASRALRGTAKRMHSRLGQRRSSAGKVTLKVAPRGEKARTLGATLVDISPRGFGFESPEIIPRDAAIWCIDAQFGASWSGTVRHCDQASKSYLVGVELDNNPDTCLPSGKINSRISAGRAD